MKRTVLAALAVLSCVPSLSEGYAVMWGVLHHLSGKALRDGLDFWAGGFLAWHGRVPVLFDAAAYNAFLGGLYGHIPFHFWSYPPNYLLLAAAFGWLAPWHAVLAFDAFSVLALVVMLRLAGKSWWLVAAVALSPVSLENILEGQNAAVMTALIGGAVLLLPGRPVLAGVLAGLATIKPQLGLALPLFLLRRSRPAFFAAALAAVALAALSILAFGPKTWVLFWTVTRPAMSAVLLTGKPAAFANGLISVFAACRFLGTHAALVIQLAATVGAAAYAATRRDAPAVLILTALASPYLHDYDLLGVTLATALLIESGLKNGFAPGEVILLFIAWFGPGALPWAPQFAHLTPLVLLLLLASAARYGRLNPCDSSQVQPNSPALPAGPSPIQNPRKSTAPG
jgi:hypothetical protein